MQHEYHTNKAIIQDTDITGFIDDFIYCYDTHAVWYSYQPGRYYIVSFRPLYLEWEDSSAGPT